MNRFRKILKWLFRLLLVGIVILVILIITWLLDTGINPFSTERRNHLLYNSLISHPQVGSVIPEYTLNIANAAHKNEMTIKLSDLKGQVVILFWYNQKCRANDETLIELEKLSRKHQEALKVFAIFQNNDDEVLTVKEDYPNLNICIGNTGFNEPKFPHLSNRHEVVFDKYGKIVTYGYGIPYGWLIEKLVKGEEFLSSEKNVMNAFSTLYKMEATWKIKSEFLEFQKCHFTDTLNASLALSPYCTIATANLSGLQTYELVTGISSNNFRFDRIDTTKLQEHYNFYFGVDYQRYDNIKKNDPEGIRRAFKQDARNKLDSILGFKSTIVVNKNDSILVFDNI